jgi:hypothetical protein
MSAMTMTTAASRLQELADRADLAELVARLGQWLDEQRFDGAAALLTSDAVVRTQSGQSRGIEALTDQARRVHTQFTATQHVTSDVLADIDADRATVRANLTATFVAEAPEPAIRIGERYHLEAARTAAGWRLSRVEVTPVWRSGELPAAS